MYVGRITGAVSIYEIHVFLIIVGKRRPKRFWERVMEKIGVVCYVLVRSGEEICTWYGLCSSL
jgi:hypothetical protein